MTMLRRGLLAVVALIAMLAAPPGFAADLPATPATAWATIKGAKSGDRVLIAPGTGGTLSLGGSATAFQFDPANPVQVLAADPAHPPVFAGIGVNAAKGLAFTGLEVGDEPRLHISVSVGNGSDHITFDRMNVHGGWRGVLFRASTNVALTNSDVHDTGLGVQVLDTANAVVSGNYLHDLAADAFDGFRVQNLLISFNTIARITAAPGTHVDAIQFALNGSSAYANDNIEVSNNVVLADTGQPMQGIFGNFGKGAIVRNNLLLNDMWNGIAVYSASAPLVEGNWAQGRLGIMSADIVPKPMGPWIYIDASSTGGQMLNNRGGIHGAPASVTQTGNLPLASAAVGDYTDAVAWFKSRGVTVGSPLAPPLPVKASPPPIVVPVDPRDATISTLQAQLLTAQASAQSAATSTAAQIADLKAQLASAQDALAKASADLASAKGDAAATQAALDAATAHVAKLQAVLASIAIAANSN